jgi:phospholipid-binding lipoprotein MlaA
MPFRSFQRVLPGCFLAAGTALAVLAGCAGPPANGATPGSAAAVEPENFNDPFENTNRAIFSFNQDVDRAVLLPVAKAYRAVLPQPVRDSVHSFMHNLNEPINFANDTLQGRFGAAGKTLARFAINTTFGVAGFLDVIPYHSNDFGITMATYGAPSGPYLMLPILGPSDPRDAIGEAVDGYADPWNQIADAHNRLWAPVVRGLVDGIDERSRNIENLADLERTSLDFYATIRSLYRQRRAAEVNHRDENLPNPSPVQGSDATPVIAPHTALAAVPRPLTVPAQ